MARADRYRYYADECRRIAEHINTPAEKSLILRMAETWLRLAERAEARDSQLGPSSQDAIDTREGETLHRDECEGPDEGQH